MKRSRSRRLARVTVFVALATMLDASCSRDDPPPVDTGPILTLDSTTYTLRRVGDSMTLTARVTRPVVDETNLPTSAPRYRSSDTAIIQIDGQTGAILAVGDGVARVWVTLDEDSVSAVVVVEEPLPFIALGNRSMHFNAVGETSPIDVSQGLEFLVDGIPAYCTSADPAVATVTDGGRVVARGNGVTRVYCEVDVALDSIDVRVEQVAARISIVESALRPIRVFQDSLEIALARVDQGGAPIPHAVPRWSTLDPDIVAFAEDGRAVGLAAGIGRVVGELDGLADTAFVSVVSGGVVVGGLRPSRVIGVEEAARAAAAVIATPEIPPEIIEAIATAAADSARADSLYLAVVQPIDVQILTDTISQTDALVVTAVAGQAEHLVNLGFGAERTSGLVFGAEVEASFGTRFGVRGGILAGTLAAAASQPAVRDRTLTHFFLESNVSAAPWLDFHLGGGLRSYADAVGTQRWRSFYAGSRARFDFVGGALRSEFKFSLMPLVSISGGINSPSLGMSGSTGLRYSGSRFTAGVEYSIERYDFPNVAGTNRLEQFAVLKMMVGIALPK